MLHRLAAALVLLLLAPAAMPASTDPAVAWFDGGVDEAFAEAAHSGKPVFLYWGAKWCPPCNQLQATVFRRPAFVEQTRNFVAVYLDGDQPGAQKWGETFAVIGYPTMIVLRPDRTELTRISGGMDLDQYPRVLDMARRQSQPVSVLVTRAQSAPASLSDDDWRLLAYYGWIVDEGHAMPAGQSGLVLSRLAASCPRPDLRARFTLLALVALIQSGQPSDALDAKGSEAARKLLFDVFADPSLVRANLAEIQGSGASLIGASSAAGTPERKTLVAQMHLAMERVFADTTYSVAERLDTADAEIGLFKLDNPGKRLSKPVAQLVHDRALWAAGAAQSDYERQAVINEASDLLDAAGAPDEAETLLRAELKRSPAPYYFMVSLADFAQRRHDAAAALDWLRRAWDASQGTATRAQWGIYYVKGLIEMKPADRAAIEAALTKMVDELSADPNAWYQRTRRKLGDLAPVLARWGATHEGADVLKHVHEKMTAVCGPLPAGSEVRKSCEGFAQGA
jgi:protein disulfide-isomerase